MMLPLAIGANSLHEPFTFDLQGAPHLFLSYCSEAQAQAFYTRMLHSLAAEGAVQFAVAFTKGGGTLPLGDALRFPYRFIRGDEYSSNTASREAFLAALVREGKRRRKLQEKGGGRTPFPHLVILLDDVMELVVSSRKAVGLAFLELLLAGHPCRMHVVAASVASCRHLLRQLMQVNPAVQETFHRLFDKYPLPVATPLGAEIVLTAEDFVFFKEAGAVDYHRLYPLPGVCARAQDRLVIS